jgi:hypothetical protein
MKAREIFVSVVASGLLLGTFCVVVITTDYVDKSVSQPGSPAGDEARLVKSTGAATNSGVEYTDRPFLESPAQTTRPAAPIRDHDSRLAASALQILPPIHRTVRPTMRRPRRVPKPTEGIYFENTAGAQPPDSAEGGSPEIVE